MDKLTEVRNTSILKFAEFLPASPAFEMQRLSENRYQVKNVNAIIDICFERGEPVKAIVELIVGAHKPMAYWILRHIRGIPVTDEERRNFSELGKGMASKLSDLFEGDKTILREYDNYANRILERISDVDALDEDHPTKMKFRNFDLNWLHDLETAGQRAV